MIGISCILKTFSIFGSNLLVLFILHDTPTQQSTIDMKLHSLLLTILTVSLPSKAISQICFSPSQSVYLGDGSTSIAKADLNNDGNIDLVTTEYVTDKVGVLFGNGSGGFTTANFQVGTHPRSVACGDFNADGNIDLVVACEDHVKIGMNDGTGNFTLTNLVSAVGTALALTTADFNTDGKIDIAISEASKVQLFKGNGNGTFNSGGWFFTGPNPYAVEAGDFNNDTKLDIATVNLGGSVTIGFGNGNGLFLSTSTTPVAINGHSLTVADFNNDGNLDVVTAHDTSSTINVLIGNGQGTFTVTSLGIGAPPAGIASGDLNNDGQVDLVAGNYDTNNVTVLLGNGAGNFPTNIPLIGAGLHPWPVLIEDFNSDGKLDFAIGNAIEYVRVFLNTAPTIYITQVGNTLFANGDATQLQWIDCDTDTAVDGATGSSYTPESPGTYSVQAQNGSCVYNSDCFAMSNLGVSKFNFSLSPRVVPNPSDGVFVIHDYNFDATEIRIYNLLGETVDFGYQQESSNTLKITIKNPVPGLYLFEDNQGVGKTWGKIIVN
jgi:hypothetical protein